MLGEREKSKVCAITCVAIARLMFLFTLILNLRPASLHSLVFVKLSFLKLSSRKNRSTLPDDLVGRNFASTRKVRTRQCTFSAKTFGRVIDKHAL